MLIELSQEQINTICEALFERADVYRQAGFDADSDEVREYTDIQDHLRSQ